MLRIIDRVLSELSMLERETTVIPENEIEARRQFRDVGLVIRSKTTYVWDHTPTPTPVPVKSSTAVAGAGKPPCTREHESAYVECSEDPRYGS